MTGTLARVSSFDQARLRAMVIMLKAAMNAGNLARVMSIPFAQPQMAPTKRANRTASSNRQLSRSGPSVPHRRL
jgi:hypothetical protein